MSALDASSGPAAPLSSGPTTTTALPGHTTTNGPKQRLSDLDTTKGGTTSNAMADMGAPSKPSSNAASAPRTAASPGSTSPAPIAPLASPSQIYQSGSPRIQSPASSQIFERNVQESASISGELSPAIPSHIQTEDHIPAVLEASSLAITDGHLDPDEVEIVTHTAHQPASAAVASSLSDPLLSPSSPQLLEDLTASQTGLAFQQPEGEDTQSTYASIDNTDIRRLSFISFADVIHAENAETNRDSVHLASLSSTTANRSPSPVRSPTSSHGFNVSSPMSGAASIQGPDHSATLPSSAVPLAPVMGGIRTPGSPTTAQSPLGGEIAIETMRQALRKTGSGDLSGARSQSLSAVSIEEGSADAPSFR